MISSGGGNLRSFTRRSTVRVLIPSRLATSALVNRSRGRPSTAVSSASSRKRMVSRRSLLMLVVQVMLGQTLTSFGQGSQRGGRHDLYRSCQLYFRGGRTWPIFLASEACFMSFPFGRATSRFIAPFFCSQCAISLFLALGRSRQYSAIAATTSSGNCASRWRVLAPAFRPNARRRFKNPSSVSCHTNGACITCVGGFVGGHVVETCSGRESCSPSATTGGRNACSVAHAQNQSAVTCAAPRSHGESARRWQQAGAQCPPPSAPAPRRRRASRLHMRAGHRHRAPRPLRDRDTVRRYRWSRRRETTAFAPPDASRESPSVPRRKLRRISPCGRPSCPVQKRRRR